MLVYLCMLGTKHSLANVSLDVVGHLCPSSASSVLFSRRSSPTISHGYTQSVTSTLLDNLGDRNLYVFYIFLAVVL